MSEQVHVLGFSGSLRRGSYNTALLRNAQQLLPAGMSLEIFDISLIPLYNQDVEAVGLPEPVKHFKQQIEAADAVLIATPEYDYSVPGVLTNAIDWASRPTGKSSFDGKVGAIMGASIGQFGTVRSQMHLRQICFYNNMLMVNKPEVLIAQAATKFDSQGRLTDPAGRQFLSQLLDALKALAIFNNQRMAQQPALAQV